MSRNGMVDYMDVTGYLPRIERNSAVCWRGQQLFISGDPCGPNKPQYLNEDETREYMVKRFGYKIADMKAKTFDNAITADIAKKQLDGLTISKGGRFIFVQGTPIKTSPEGIREHVTTDMSGKRVVIQMPGAEEAKQIEESGYDSMGYGNSTEAIKSPKAGTGMAMLVIALAFAAIYLIFGKGRTA
jgi:hypothetical protein